MIVFMIVALLFIKSRINNMLWYICTKEYYIAMTMNICNYKRHMNKSHKYNIKQKEPKTKEHKTMVPHFLRMNFSQRAFASPGTVGWVGQNYCQNLVER